MFSCAAGREEHCKQISLACVRSACSVWATLGLPLLTAVLSWSTLLRLQVVLLESRLRWALGCMHFPGISRSGSGSWVLRKGTDSVGPAFCALLRSEQLRQPGAWRAHSPQVGVRLIASPVLATRECCLRCAVCLLWGANLSSTLLAGVNHPRSREELASNWEPAGRLAEDAISGAEFAPLWLWLSPACLPASSGGRASPRLALLWYSFSPLFCERVWQCLRLELFAGKFSLSLSSFFPLSGYPTVWVAISRQLPQIALRAFRPGPYPEQSSGPPC